MFKIKNKNLTFYIYSYGGSEAFYNDAVEQAANFNVRLKNDRKMRLPFLDSQTGVAQSHTDLWHSYRHRRPGQGLIVVVYMFRNDTIICTNFVGHTKYILDTCLFDLCLVKLKFV